MNSKPMPNYQKMDKGSGLSVKVSYPTPEKAKVEHNPKASDMVNFMGLGQYSDWL